MSPSQDPIVFEVQLILEPILEPAESSSESFKDTMISYLYGGAREWLMFVTSD